MIDFDALRKPFPEEYLEWRAGATTRDKKKAQALPYADPRAYEDRLNEVIGEDWSCHFKPWGDTRIICELTVSGVTRTSTGEFDNSKRNAIAEGTVAEAQAFKRACSKFGLGRYLYDIPIQWLDYDIDKNRFLETPKLGKQFLPNATKPAPASAPTIGKQRAADLVLNALEHFGVDQDAVQAAVNTYRGDSGSNAIEDLTEDDVKKIWGYLKTRYEHSKK